MTTARQMQAHFGQAYRDRQMAVNRRRLAKDKRVVILAMRKWRKRINTMYRLQAKAIRNALIPAFHSITEATSRAAETMSKLFTELKTDGYLEPIDEDDYALVGWADEI